MPVVGLLECKQPGPYLRTKLVAVHSCGDSYSGNASVGSEVMNGASIQKLKNGTE